MGYYTLDINQGTWIKVEDSPLELGMVTRESLHKLGDWVLEFDENAGFGLAHTVVEKAGKYNGKEHPLGIYFGAIVGEEGKSLAPHAFKFIQDTFYKRILESALEGLKNKKYLIPVTGETPESVIEEFKHGLESIQPNLRVRKESVYDGIEQRCYNFYLLN